MDENIKARVIELLERGLDEESIDQLDSEVYSEGIFDYLSSMIEKEYGVELENGEELENLFNETLKNKLEEKRAGK